MSLFKKEYYVVMIDDFGCGKCCVYVCWAKDNEFEWCYNPNEARMFESAKDAEEFCFYYLDSYFDDDEYKKSFFHLMSV